MRARAGGPPAVVSVVGLGIGTLAAYGRPGDDFRFYEIDPEVIRLARDDGRFTFLRDSAAQVEVVPGDARLSLQRENGSRKSDVLVLDAFTSGSIPVHLLTLEALELYQRALADGGVIAFNVSSNHLDLVRLLFRTAEHIGMPALATSNDDAGTSFHSRWVILSRNKPFLQSVAQAACQERTANPRVWFPNAESVADTPVWSDDYSNLFEILALDSSFRDLRTAGNFCAGS
jgi:spermidine synthase